MSQHPAAVGSTLAVFGLPGGGEWILLGLTFLVYLTIDIVVCCLLQPCLNRIPPEHRRMDPALVWLLLIPVFGRVWNFFVFLRLPESYQSYFAAQGRQDVGDCGRALGLWYAILSAIMLVVGYLPIVSCFPGLAVLIVLILFLVKALNLKGLIGAPQQQPMGIQPPPA